MENRRPPRQLAGWILLAAAIPLMYALSLPDWQVAIALGACA